MNKIEKKIWPEYFQQVLDGKKTYDLRLNDFEINEGDILVLKEWDPNTKDYTGRKLERRVGYVGKCKMDELAQFLGEEEAKNKGIQVISIIK